MKLYYEDHLVGTITIEKDGLGIRGRFSYAQSWLTNPNVFLVSLSISLSSHESSHAVSEWIGNVDAHAKNYGVLLSHGAPRFAPPYDTLCCAVYAQEKTGRLSQNMSQKIGGRFNPNTLRRAHWERFADDVDLPRATVFDAMKSVESAIRHHAGIMMNEAGHSDFTRSILTKIDRKARHVAALGKQITKPMQAKQANKNQCARPHKDPQP